MIKLISEDEQVEAFQWYPGLDLKDFGKVTGSQEKGYVFTNPDYSKTINPGDWIVWYKAGYVSIISERDFKNTMAFMGIEFPVNAG